MGLSRRQYEHDVYHQEATCDGSENVGPPACPEEVEQPLSTDAVGLVDGVDSDVEYGGRT